MFSDFENIDLTGLKVLVAESDRMNLIRIYELLTSIGCEVIVTHKSIETVEKNLIYKPDIILINVEISDNRYSDAIKIIRNNEQTENHVPIIGLTSGITLKNRSELNKVEPDDLLKNTFTKKDFYSLLQKHISGKIASLNTVNNSSESVLSVFNIRAFENHFHSNQDKMKSNLQNFMKNVPQLIIKLKVAVATGYFPEIESFAHSIKGIASNVFLERLKTAAYHVEIIGKTRDNSKLIGNSSLIKKLEKEFREAKKEIDEFLSKK